jgi:hypothetical protein
MIWKIRLKEFFKVIFKLKFSNYSKEEDTNTSIDADVNWQQVKKDDRFTALFHDSAFAIDKTHSQYKGGDLANRQVNNFIEI